ncbi:MAG: hypothetical protein HY015_08680 [Bacteroidetes bacterium]|nr:hypothetical protein [Bacteroidota bacterium]MBI3483031.1 hypothetical protein [Bacteroidota bacterium]
MKNKEEKAANLEVGQRVGHSENPEQKTAGHSYESFAKMMILLEYCFLILSEKLNQSHNLKSI